MSRTPLTVIESLEQRALLSAASFNAEFQHQEGQCREIDNVQVPIHHSTFNSDTQFILVSTPAGYGEPIPVGPQHNFDGCDFNDVGGEGENPTPVATITLGNGDTVQLFENPDFWQNPFATVTIGNQQFQGITRVAFARQIGFINGTPDVRQYSTLTSDGYLRQINLPQSNGVDITFNSSAIVGPTILNTLPSGEERYSANIGNLIIDPNGGGWQASHIAGGSSHVAFQKISAERTELQVSFTGVQTQTPIILTSMNSTDGDTHSDMNAVFTVDQHGEVTQMGHIRDFAGTSANNITGLGIYKTGQTDHNTNGVDLAVYVDGTNPVGGTTIWEAEAFSTNDDNAQISFRDKASPALNPNMGVAVHMIDHTTTYQTSVQTSGWHTYSLDYSRESNDATRPHVSLYANGQLVGSFDGTSSRLPSTGAIGEAWNEPKPQVFGRVYHEAGEDVLLELVVESAIHGDSVGIEADVLTRALTGLYDPEGGDLFGNRNGAWWVARSNGSSGFNNEHWGAWNQSAGWQDVLNADVDGDGDADIVARTGSGQWWVFRNTGSSFSNEYWGAFAVGTWTDVQVADVDGDGNDDIVGRLNGNWWVARSNGVNGFSNQLWGYWVPNNWQDVQVADVDGDGNDDIVGRLNGNWWVAHSNGTNFTNENWGSWTPNNWQDVYVADVDGDSQDDIVGRRNGNWWVARSTGSGFTTELWGSWATGNWQDVQVADVDGDGSDDIIGRLNDFWWVANSVDNHFESTIWGAFGNIGWQSVQTIDVDQDGNTDIVGHANNGSLWVARSNGVDGFDNELWGHFSVGNWQHVMSGFGTNSGLSGSVIPVAEEDDEPTIFG